MSVRSGDRQAGRKQIYDKFRLLNEYTLLITKSKKTFTKQQDKALIKPILEELQQAGLCLDHAFAAFYIKDISKYYRKNELLKAHGHLEGLLKSIEIAYNQKCINGRLVEYWIKLIIETDELIKV